MSKIRTAPSQGGPRGVVRRALVSRVSRLLSALQRTQQEHRRSQFAELGAPSGRVVFLGDSISEFGLWDEWFPKMPVLNRGIGGETSGQVLARLDTAINEPRAVFLLVGTNDLTADMPLDTIVSNVREIVDRIESRAPGTPLFLQSVMPRTADFAAEIHALNRRYQQVAESAGEHVRFLDLWPTLADPSGALDQRFTRDRLHLNGRGYRAWVELLRPELAALATEAAG